MPPRSALLLGATGLVGGHCLDALLADEAYEAVTTLGRRPLGRTHPKLTHHVVDFDRLAEHAGVLTGRDVFCCLGTTIKQAGSRDAFRRVDLLYPREAARLARANGAEQYLLVSALGASSRSPVFYNRVKGEAEEAILEMPFVGTYVFRPSLLLGERDAARPKEQLAEKVLGALSFALRGPLRAYKPIEGRTVARAMVTVAKAAPGGIQIYEPDAIRDQARR
jgi:uncharacterized protein YbjT (DUF2867 family)